MAVMMSAVISSLTSVFNSAGSVFTLDIWTRIRPSASQRELLITGRYVAITTYSYLIYRQRLRAR